MKIKSRIQKLNSKDRLYEIPVPLIGLTGGIATGKSTVGKILEKKGFAVIDADKLVKDIYQLEEAKSLVRILCPEALKSGEILFPILREKFFTDPALKTKIETFIYERLPAAFNRALTKIGQVDVIIYDVPLLFEKRLERFFDLTVLVYAPRDIQRARLMQRDNHNESMAETILKQQMDIEEKKSKSGFIINNSQTEAELAMEVQNFIGKVFN